MFQGSNVTVMTTMPATLFGRKHLGSIAASMYISGQLTSAAGSGVFGAAKDAAGAFGPLFQFLIACLTFQAALLVAEGGVQHPARQTRRGSSLRERSAATATR